MSAYEKVLAARDTKKLTSADYIHAMFGESFIELHGDRNYADDKAVIGGVGMLNEMPVTVIGLEKGSDDYITKPFSPKELVLRVNAIMRRVYREENRIQIDGYEIDENERVVYDNGTPLELTTKEFDLLMMFVKNKGTAFLREQILTQIWGQDFYGSDRVVDDTLRRLRRKMPNISIRTIYGFGYRLG